MKTATILSSTALVVMNAGSAYASLGQFAKLFTEFTADGLVKTTGEVSNRAGKRSFAPINIDVRQVPGVPQEEYDRCRTDVTGLTVDVNSPAEDTVQFTGIPPACMNLANVLVGNEPGPYALPCGSDCLQYSGLTVDEYNQIADTFNAAQ